MDSSAPSVHCAVSRAEDMRGEHGPSEIFLDSASHFLCVAIQVRRR
jgi:hypothetical protein